MMIISVIIVQRTIVQNFFLIQSEMPSLFRGSSQLDFLTFSISQGSVVTCLRWHGLFNDCCIANFLENATANKFFKIGQYLTKLCWQQNIVAYFFGPPSIYMYWLLMDVNDVNDSNVEGIVPEDHHDWYTDRSAVVHLRWRKGLFPSATPSATRDARISEEEVGRRSSSSRF